MKNLVAVLVGLGVAFGQVNLKPNTTDPCAAQRPGDKWYSEKGGNGKVTGCGTLSSDSPLITFSSVAPSIPASYNLILPAIKPSDGLYIVKMQAGVMTFVSPYKSTFPLFVATGGMIAILMFLVGFHFRGKESK